jgi:UDP-3-O-[3-hydroxymyristoyl] glucosamine N-acyltransferase
MTDTRFFHNTGPYTAQVIAELVGARVLIAGGAHSNNIAAIDFFDVAPLQTASSREISFLDNTKYIDHFGASKAGGCLVHEKHVAKAPNGMVLFICEEPYVAYAKVATLFFPMEFEPPHISPMAHISPDAIIGEGVCIKAGAVIEAGAKIGNHTHIGANTCIGRNVEIGEYSSIGANSTVSHALIGSRVIIHRGVHIGQDGFGFAPSKTGIVKVPQLGRVVIEDHVEIGSGTTIDRGSSPDTKIGAHTKIDNLVQIGHNVQIGKFCFFAGQSGVSGSTIIEDGVMVGGQSGFAGHLYVGRGAKIAAKSGVMTDVPAGATYTGAPAIPHREFFKQVATLKKLATTKGNTDE